MAKKFTHKKPGDALTAKDINDLQDAARSIRPPLHGSHLSGVHTSTGAAVLSRPPFQQWVFRITSDEGQNIYKGHKLYYSEEDSVWKPTDTQYANGQTTGDSSETDKIYAKEWFIDANAIGLQLALGTYVNAHWDAQRGMFIPLISNFRNFVLARLNETLRSGTSARATLYTGVSSSGTYTLSSSPADIITVHDFFHRNTAFDLGVFSDILAMYHSDFDRYILINTVGQT